MIGTRIPRSNEAEAYLDALQDHSPESVSACNGWTTHEVTAHLTGIAAEVTRHLDPYLEGQPVPATRSFEVREAPYRAMLDGSLRARLEDEELRMRLVIDQVLEREPGAVIPWTGRQMAVAKFIPHVRNEFAVHRWDICGDDEVGDRLLAQPELTEHAVSVLGEILLRKGVAHDPQPGRPFAVWLRSPGAADLRVVVQGDRAALELATDGAGGPFMEMDAAARALFIWGRRPDRRGRARSFMDAELFQRLSALLAGY